MLILDLSNIIKSKNLLQGKVIILDNNKFNNNKLILELNNC